MDHEPRRWCVVRALRRDDVLRVRECRLSDDVPGRLVAEAGAASAEWLDAAGEVLATHPLRVSTAWTEPDGGVSPPAADVVAGAVPVQVGASALRLTCDGAVVTLPVGERPPQIELIDGPRGLVEDPVVRLAVSVDDGADVRVHLRGRGTPLRMAAEPRGGQLEVDLEGVAGDELWLEVSATRDVRTALVRTAVFGRPMTRTPWHVVSPPPHAVQAPGSTVELHAVVIAEIGEEVLSDRPVTWHSSIEGVVAEGARAAVVLGAGDHVLELRRGEDVLAATEVRIEVPA